MHVGGVNKLFQYRYHLCYLYSILHCDGCVPVQVLPAQLGGRLHRPHQKGTLALWTLLCFILFHQEIYKKSGDKNRSEKCCFTDISFHSKVQLISIEDMSCLRILIFLQCGCVVAESLWFVFRLERALLISQMLCGMAKNFCRPFSSGPMLRVWKNSDATLAFLPTSSLLEALSTALEVAGVYSCDVIICWKLDYKIYDYNADCCVRLCVCLGWVGLKTGCVI